VTATSRSITWGTRYTAPHHRQEARDQQAACCRLGDVGAVDLHGPAALRHLLPDDQIAADLGMTLIIKTARDHELGARQQVVPVDVAVAASHPVGKTVAEVLPDDYVAVNGRAALARRIQADRELGVVG